MPGIKDIQSNTFGSIAAVQTLVNNYPSLKNTDSISESLDLGTSLGYILALLRVLGVTETDIVAWLSKLLCGENVFADSSETALSKAIETGGDGILDIIEYAIKGVLFANIKDLFGGCPVEPIIPDWLIDKQGPDGNIGLNIRIPLIDTFGTLQQCPCDSSGSIYYFDAKPSIFGYDYTPNNVNKSTDFNAFLWHVINKSGSDGDVWDNRFNVQKNLLADSALTENFFNTDATGIIKGEDEKTQVKKKRILICKYKDTGAVTDGDGIINVTLPADNYRYSIGNSTVYFNKTIFQFNYDYIFSLKLFDTKTLVANILNSLLSLSSTIDVGVSFEKQMAKQKVAAIIDNIMRNDSNQEDSTSTSESTVTCAAKFSNKQYDKMLKKTDDARAGIYTLGNTNIQLSDSESEVIQEKIKLLSQTTDQKEAIKDLINTAADKVSGNNSVSVSAKFNFNCNFIYDFLQQTITEIVMQVMSPKVMMLYVINTALMGDVTDIEGWKKDFQFTTFEDIWNKLENLFESIISQVVEIVVKQLFQFLMDTITPIIKLFTMKLLLETIKDYKDLITQLITTCMALGISIATYPDGTLNIDDVNYADIVPTQTSPGTVNC